MKFDKVKLLVFGSVFLLSWILGVLRFDYQWALGMYKVILFPFGLLYILYESYCTETFSSSHFWNNEFVQLSIWVISVFMQYIVYYLLLIKVKFRKQIVE